MPHAGGWGARIAALIGATLIAASATPLPAWTYLGWLILFVAAFALEAKFLPHRGAVGVVLALILFSVAMYAHELGYRRAPIIPIHHGQTVYVIGDSISAGIGKEKPWPKVLQETHGIAVVNLARRARLSEPPWDNCKD